MHVSGQERARTVKTVSLGTTQTVKRREAVDRGATNEDPLPATSAKVTSERSAVDPEWMDSELLLPTTTPPPPQASPNTDLTFEEA